MLPLDPKQSGFSWSNARACAERCALAYVETSSSLRTSGLTKKFIWNSQTDTEALVIREPECVSATFRGSTNLKDWLQDFKVAKEHPRADLIYEPAGEVVQVHKGFMEDVESVSAGLTHAIRSLTEQSGTEKLKNSTVQNSSLKSPPIFVTGHSKGAAEAVLFALELQRQNLPIASVYLFGCPRVGNLIFRNIYNSVLYEETFRIVNENDIVPRVPGVLLGYRHCGQEIFLPVGGGWNLNPSIRLKLLSDAVGFWSAYRNKQDVLLADHDIAAYQKRIQIL